ncbi:MAG TPA: formyltransferase family protein [Patescibacteria group bacterium]|nr:formyltransferase family protein [Patescibacteria group bacterium]
MGTIEAVSRSIESIDPPHGFDIAVMVSNKSSGSNFRALLEAEARGELGNARIKMGIADRITAPALQHGRDFGRGVAGIRYRVINGDTEAFRDFFTSEVATFLNTQNIKIAVMAGFNRKLNKNFFKEYEGELLNVHPGALPDENGDPYVYEETGEVLPWNPGMMTEDAIQVSFDRGLSVVSSTVHIATEELDKGPVLIRVFEKIVTGDTPTTAYARLKVKESQGLIQAINSLAR